MRIIASYNIKGGVGKTATVVNLAYLCAAAGHRTLLWDLDPQGAASFYYRIRPKVKGGGKKLLHKQSTLEQAIKATDFDNLDLLPADFSYRHMDLILEDVKKPQKRLRKVLNPLRDEYDVIFLDCAPSISLVSESVLQAADLVLVPTIPTTLSLRTYEQIIKYCQKAALPVTKIAPFFSMVDRRKLLHRMIVDKPPKTMDTLLATTVPYASDVEQMGIKRMPVNCYAASSSAGEAYVKLWQELTARVDINC